jgi:hypothetical protein
VPTVRSRLFLVVLLWICTHVFRCIPHGVKRERTINHGMHTCTCIFGTRRFFPSMAEGCFVVYLLLGMLSVLFLDSTTLYFETKLLSFSPSCLLHGHLSWKHGLRAFSEGGCFIKIRLVVNILHFGRLWLLCLSYVGLSSLVGRSHALSSECQAQADVTFRTLVWSSLGCCSKPE